MKNNVSCKITGVGWVKLKHLIGLSGHWAIYDIIQI